MKFVLFDTETKAYSVQQFDSQQQAANAAKTLNDEAGRLRYCVARAPVVKAMP